MNNDGLEDLGVNLVSIIGKNVNLKIAKLAGAGAVDIVVTTTLTGGLVSTTTTTIMPGKETSSGEIVKEAKKTKNAVKR